MRIRAASIFSSLLCVSALAGMACTPSPVPGGSPETDRTATTPKPVGKTEAGVELHQPFGVLLGKYVRSGKVDYRRWREDAGDRGMLGEYLKKLAAFNPETLDENGRKAFWINAYNAVTVSEVLDRYPLASVNFDELKDPKAKDFWNTATTVGNRQVTLNDIENVILRPTFKDPRIHFVINCASNGCPILQSMTFEAARLETQLDDAAKSFLTDATRGAAFNEKTGALSVSPIFKWYAADFGDVAAFVAKFRPDLAGKIKKVEFQGYDWRLNDTAGSR